MIIKSERREYHLVAGDWIMDNGACYQLASRKALRGWYLHTPLITKTEFAKFMSLNPKKTIINNGYGTYTKWEVV